MVGETDLDGIYSSYVKWEGSATRNKPNLYMGISVILFRSLFRRRTWASQHKLASVANE